jgi:hypothetical protein
MMRQRSRDRRFVPEKKRRWFEKLCAMKRIRQELHKHGTLIHMHLVLHKGLSPTTAMQVIETFRRAGFVAYSAAHTTISLTGEPCLALAFMDSAAAAGVLSQAFHDCLDELFDDDTPRPGRTTPLDELGKLFAAIQSVDVPRRSECFASVR